MPLPGRAAIAAGRATLGPRPPGLDHVRVVIGRRGGLREVVIGRPRDVPAYVVVRLAEVFVGERRTPERQGEQQDPPKTTHVASFARNAPAVNELVRAPSGVP